MALQTGVFLFDVILSILFDGRFQLVVGLLSSVYFIWRQPRPRKGAGNRAIFITGCDTGFGHQIAKRLDQLKVHVFAGCLKPDGEGAKALKEKCSSRLHIVPLDVTDDKMVKEAVAYVQKNLPCGEKGLYALVNNAGIADGLPFELTSLQMCEEIVKVNLMGTIRVTKHFLPLVKQVPGRIVTITSVLARLSYKTSAVYTATKHGQDAFFRNLRWDLADSGVLFPVVEPGAFTRVTDIIQNAQRHLDDMWNNLQAEEKEEKQHLYDVAKNICVTKLSESEQETKYKIFLDDIEDALFAEEPYERYVSDYLSHKIRYAIYRLLPDSVNHKIRGK